MPKLNTGNPEVRDYFIKWAYIGLKKRISMGGVWIDERMSLKTGGNPGVIDKYNQLIQKSWRKININININN